MPAPFAALYRRLCKMFPTPKCALDHRNPFELLVATVLSAQCTDVRVNLVTPDLFLHYPTPARLATADLFDVERRIHSTGFYRNKAKALVGLAAQLERCHGGKVPRTLRELVALPGVARKTANVVLGVGYGLAEGLVVDTHVGRLARRLGLTASTDPIKVEADLLAYVPKRHWIDFSHRLILHGRDLCKARSPRCGDCPLAPLCPTAGGEVGLSEALCSG